MKTLKRALAVGAGGFAIGVLAVTWSHFQNRPEPAKAAESKIVVSHAKVDRLVNESDLNTVELSSAAEERLGIELTAIQIRSMPRLRSYGAEMVLPTGASVIVSAPLSGSLRHPNRGRFPQVGQRIRAGETLLELMPLLTPERSVLTPAERIRFAEAKLAVAQAQIEAERQFQEATVQVEAAQIALARAERLLADNVGTKRAVDDATAQWELAEKTLAAAKERKQLVDHIKLDEEAGTLEPLAIESPLDGIVRTTHVQTGQLIAAGLPLFEVMNDEVMWIKVPVYVGELNDIDANQPARLTLLDGRQTEGDVVGKPVSLPPTALPLSSAVDLYYEVPNPDHKFSPGQRVAAHLPLTGEIDMQAVPWSAVFHDIYGGQWVYEQVAERTYARRRVEVGWIDGDWAALLRGPAMGTLVVTAGVAELAGTEFGFAK
jgi:RND family efflux transporter MFP subunit